MTAVLAPWLIDQFFNQNATAVALGYKLFTYQAGTTTKQPTYTDSTQSVQNSNPIILDSTGVAGTGLWLDPTLVYKFVLALPNDSDPPVSPIRTIDNVYPDINSSTVGQVLFPRTAAEIAAGVTPTNYIPATDIWYNIKRYGAGGNNVSTNLSALNTAILVAQNSAGAANLTGVTIVIPPDCPYGYVRTNVSTYPQLSGTVPILVLDYSQGSSYSGYPTAYDGTQFRQFYYTPQTTTPGFHDGNGFMVAGAWAPYIVVNNTENNANPSVNTTDNLRANYLTYVNGGAAWNFGQGSRSGSGLIPGQMANWQIQRFSGAAQTLTFTAAFLGGETSGTLNANWNGDSGIYPILFSNSETHASSLVHGAPGVSWVTGLGSAATATATIGTPALTPMIVDYLTMNMMFGASSNNAQTANYWFKASMDRLFTHVIEGLSDPVYSVLRDPTGSSNDVWSKNNSGDWIVSIQSQGDGIKVSKTDRTLTTNTRWVGTRALTTYSASITIDASTANWFFINANNGTAFTINTPTNPSIGQRITIKIQNTSGGALGVITWSASFKMATLTSPGNGFEVALDFIYDGANWRQIGTPANNVPN